MKLILLALPFLLPVAPLSDDEIRIHLAKLLAYQRRNMNVDPVDGEYFTKIVLDLKAKRVLEIGTSNGYSGLWFAMGLRRTGGKLITLELDRGRWTEAQENFRLTGLAPFIDSRLVNALEEIPRIEGPLDIVFIDAWKPDYLKYYELVLPKLRPGGAILAHNVRNLPGQMSDFLSRIRSDSAVRTEFFEPSHQGLSVSWKR